MQPCLITSRTTGLRRQDAHDVVLDCGTDSDLVTRCAEAQLAFDAKRETGQMLAQARFAMHFSTYSTYSTHSTYST